MTSEEMLYVKGAKIWIPHEEQVWESATITGNYHEGAKTLKYTRDFKKDGEELELNIKIDGSNLPPLKNPTILIGQNDLTSLSYLHEPGVLHNLRVRFCEKQIIYTYCGIILVAINPYAERPLYGPSIIRAYRGRSIGELEPHIFALSEEAYAKLERENCDLSIIVSGESGAGKTVSAKYAMRYFAAVGGSESETQVERKVLASSPIMEAFGNAKTTRNDNSSRFGKFIKLLFKNDMGSMILTGAAMNTYLLEKSRVVFQSYGERNYHIFYQLCSMRGSYHELILDHQDKFEYLNKGKSPDIEKISDKEQFRETLQAMQILGFTNQQITDVLKILASILHLGNITFMPKFKANTEEIDPDACEILPNDLHLHITGELLKINSDDLRQWLMYRQIASVNENVLIPNNIDTAVAAKDALAKHIYSKLFQYIVGIINKSLNISRHQGAGNFIGVLDIYGFETFDTNSFEQFCINYANEKLQQQFNQHVFKLEQEEYLKEGITWTMIDFYDNQPCIDLIEAKLGVLDLLDEECRMPKGSDESWAGKLFEKCMKYPHFGKARFGTTSFLIKHFSDTVEYDVNGFLEKNRDTVSRELVNVIRKSDMSLCKQIMELEEIDTLSEDVDKMTTLDGRVVISAARKQVAPSKQHKRSVGSQFRDSLSSLIKTLHSTVPHYVRCIKPNDDKIAFKWEASKIVQQLRACGVLETVRISAAGFPSRWLYQDFYMRYQLLCHRSQLNKNNIKEFCQIIVTKWILDEDKYRFGNSQIFFRAGQVAYLEQIRANLRKKYIIIVQSLVRRYLCHKRYQKLRKCITGLQTHSRGFLARQKTQKLREERAAMIIAKYAKGYLCRRRYLRLSKSVLGIQQYARGLLARKRYHLALDNYKAIQIQRFVRGYLSRRAYNQKRRNIIICQSAIRRYLARRQFKKMKAEAKSISYMEKKYKGLENKIISMQQKIDELNRENASLKQRTAEISVLKLKLETKKNIEVELKNLKNILNEKDDYIEQLLKKLENEKNLHVKMIAENTQSKNEIQVQKEQWILEKNLLLAQIQEITDKAKSLEISQTKQNAQLISEAESKELNEAYQRALKEKEIIENENYLLKDELKKLSKQMGISEYSFHQRSMSNASSQNEEDIGYVSAKNTLESRSHAPVPVGFAHIDSSGGNKSDQTSLILKLRSILEDEKLKNKFLAEKLSKFSLRTSTVSDDPISTHYKISELELENEKLRSDYDELRRSIEMGKGTKELNDQYEAMQAELRRRREEIIHLKAVLQEQNQSLKYMGSDSMKKGGDNELIEAFQAQKLINRQLEAELMALTEENNAHLGELTVQIEQLREEKSQLQEVLNAGLENLDEADIKCLKQNECYLKLQLEKALKQYLELQEETNNLNRKFDALKKGNENLSNKVAEQQWTFGEPNLNNNNNNVVARVGKQRTHSYQGLMKFQREDIKDIIKVLVIEMQPKTYRKLMPGLPAYILFMCIRYTDLTNADEDVSSLLTQFVMHLKKVHRTSVVPEMRIMWIVNSIVLLNLMKQYGDCEEYIKYNTEKQNEQQLKNFNLAQYRKVILEIIIHFYQALVKQIQTSLEANIVPGMLDSDEIQRSGHGYGMRSRITSSVHKEADEELAIGAKKQIIGKLSHFYQLFKSFGLESCYADQIFSQLMYYICAVSMNSLMLRGDIFGWETGMIIRYNLGHIERWVCSKQMSQDILTPLAPLNEMSQLLQSRKSEGDVQSVCDLCGSLNTAQVLKVMKSYKPLEDSEVEITNNFIEMLTKKLEARGIHKNNDDFTIDQKFIHSFKVVYKHSDIKLEDIELPPDLGLEQLLQKI